MARIPEDQIEWIKQSVPIERLCRRYNIELKPAGKNLVGHCPFHQDDTPVVYRHPGKKPVALHGRLR
jgi:DNA primase